MNELPEELRRQPTPVVALVNLGIDPTEPCAPWQQTINENLGANPWNQEVLRLDFSSVLPKRKEKHNYETYVPDGILKWNWMRKHVKVLPASIGVFFDWDEPRGTWPEREAEIHAQLEQVRGTAKSRGIKCVTVLVQSKSLNDETIWRERLNALKNKCELDAKTCVILNAEDPTNLSNGLAKVQQMLYDLAVAYYHEEARKVKRLRESVVKNPLLMVRHQFKIAFYGELRGVNKVALKYYRLGYSALKDVKGRDPAEVKAVAEFFNYKICRILLGSGKLSEATDSFNAHVNSLKEKIGAPEREFEHWAWVSRQYAVFGELLELKLQRSVAPDGVAHPGFFYHTASSFSKLRLKAAQRLTGNVTASAGKAMLQSTTGILEQVFVGQPPQMKAHPLEVSDDDAPTATLSLEILLAKEATVDHSGIIIDLLARAYEQFKRNRSARMTLMVAAEMGEEYFRVQNYDMALKFYQKIAVSYRKEGWSPILRELQKKCMYCAVVQGDSSTYLDYLLQLMCTGLDMPRELDHRSSMQESFTSFLKGENVPASLPPLSTVVELLVNGERPFADCVVFAAKTQYEIGTTVALSLAIKVATPLPIRIERISLVLSDAALDLSTTVNENNEPLELKPGEDVVLKFEKSFLEAKVLTFDAIVLQLSSKVHVVQKNPALRIKSRHGTVIPNISIVDSASAIDLNLSHASPCLVNEFYPVKITLQPHTVNVLEGTLTCELFLAGVATAAPIFGAPNQPLEGNSLTVPAVHQGGEHQVTVYVHIGAPGDRTLHCKLAYKTDRYTTMKDAETIIHSQVPFGISYRFVSAKLQDHIASRGFVPFDTRCTMVATIACTAPFPIYLIDAELTVEAKKENTAGSGFAIEGKPVPPAVPGRAWQMSSADEYSIMVPVRATTFAAQVPVGVMKLLWSRESGSDTNVYMVRPPPVRVEKMQASCEITTPSSIALGSAFDMAITIHNHHPNLAQEFTARLADSGNFLLAGYRETSFKVLPGSSQALTFTLFPLIAGRVQLPEVVVTPVRYQTPLVESKQSLNIWVEPAL